MTARRDEWEQIRRLGEGGQSIVYLVRTPKRLTERVATIDEILKFNPWGTVMADTRSASTGRFAQAVVDYARPESPSELGAMKVFKLGTPGDEIEARSRLHQEVTVLQQQRTGLPKLLDSNEAEGWIVTEYFPRSTLENQSTKYKGKAVAALRAFRSLVRTVALLHREGYVHRDIKPANVFVRADDDLVLGDFGIVFMPGMEARVTQPDERVGPRDYMPDWGNLGTRLERVEPNFDVYMLGKLLWSMIDGRRMLSRERHRHADFGFDLTSTFPNDPHMHTVNRILDKCVVEHPRDCLSSAADLLLMVEAFLSSVDRGGQLLATGVPRPCHICGIGLYQPNMLPNTQPPIPGSGPLGLRFWLGGSDTATVPVYPFVCDNCGHVELFTRPSPGTS